MKARKFPICSVVMNEHLKVSVKNLKDRKVKVKIISYSHISYYGEHYYTYGYELMYIKNTTHVKLLSRVKNIREEDILWLIDYLDKNFILENVEWC